MEYEWCTESGEAQHNEMGDMRHFDRRAIEPREEKNRTQTTQLHGMQQRRRLGPPKGNAQQEIFLWDARKSLAFLDSRTKEAEV